MAVDIGGRELAQGRGRTKKLAEQLAASAALGIVQRGEVPPSKGEENS